MTLKISSTAFSHQGNIPRLYTSQGEDRSPPLSWQSVPPTAKSLVLIVDDPDAPRPCRAKNDLGSLAALQPAGQLFRSARSHYRASTACRHIAGHQ